MKKIIISFFTCLYIAINVYANDIPNADLGIVLKETSNQIVVEKLIPSNNRENNSLRVGDIITEIDGIPVENLSLKDIQAKTIGKKGSKVSMQILRETEYQNFFGKIKIQLTPMQITMTRNYEIDRYSPVKVFKDGDRYSIKMEQGNKNLYCDVVYKKENSQYIRKMKCSYGLYYDGKYLKIPTETWIDFDKLIFNKYNEYSLWHNNPNPVIKTGKELQLAKKQNPPPPKNGDPCGTFANPTIGVWQNGACVTDWTKGMTKQEKDDFFRALEFQEELEHYKKYKYLHGLP